MSSLESTIHYIFANPDLLQQALTHPSATKKRGDRGYERLEFLGDRVLGLVIAEMLFAAYPEENEGQIAKRHAALVRKETCVEVARSLGLAQWVKAAANDVDTFAAAEDTMLADACEALIGALYLDGGLLPPKTFIQTYWQPNIHAAHQPPQDAKSALQEWAQGRGMNRPSYSLAETVGPDHHPMFRVMVTLASYPSVFGEAATKKKAEQLAAEQLLKELGAW